MRKYSKEGRDYTQIEYKVSTNLYKWKCGE